MRQVPPSLMIPFLTCLVERTLPQRTSRSGTAPKHTTIPDKCVLLPFSSWFEQNTFCQKHDLKSDYVGICLAKVQHTDFSIESKLPQFTAALNTIQGLCYGLQNSSYFIYDGIGQGYIINSQ